MLGEPYGILYSLPHTAATQQHRGCTHHSLNQLHSLVADLVDDSRNIQHILLAHLLQDMVYSDECPCPSHTSTAERSSKSGTLFNVLTKLALPAVDHERSLPGPVFLDHSPVEGQDGSGIVRHSVVWPGCEVKLCHFHGTL